MEQNVITINQLIAQMLDEMKRVGYISIYSCDYNSI